tara:strand:- start:11 stop:409 length:399 start_codon:yes stop_codon:yes gene_type:complete
MNDIQKKQKELLKYRNSLHDKTDYLISVLKYVLSDSNLHLDKHQIAIILYECKSIMTLANRVKWLEEGKDYDMLDVTQTRMYNFLSGLSNVDTMPAMKNLNLAQLNGLLVLFKEQYFRFLMCRHGLVINNTD